VGHGGFSGVAKQAAWPSPKLAATEAAAAAAAAVCSARRFVHAAQNLGGGKERTVVGGVERVFLSTASWACRGLTRV